MDSPFFTEDEQPTMENFNRKFRALIGAGVKIEVVSYVGTGTYGPSNPTSITFTFSPKMIWQLSNTKLIFSDNVPVSYEANKTFGTSQEGGSAQYYYAITPYGKKSEDGKTIFWYVAITGNSTGSVPSYAIDCQLNKQGESYSFIAIG